jgi:hypothetical protein
MRSPPAVAYLGRVRLSRNLVLLPLAALFALGAAAVAAPTAQQPPTISGEPRYRSVLGCDPGAWAGAVSFGYRWVTVPGGSFDLGTEQTYTAEASTVGDELYCEVTATDAAGETAKAISEPVTVGPARYVHEATLSSPRSRTIRAQGRVTPRHAATGGSVVLYRPEGGGRFVQLDRKDLKPNGRFTLQYDEENKGRRTYLLAFRIRGDARNVYEGRDEIERRVKIKR